MIGAAYALAGEAARPTLVTARLLAPVDTATNRAQVSLFGSEAAWLPFVPGTYTDITTVFVAWSPGTGHVVVGPCYQEDAASVPAPPPPPPAASDPSPVLDKALIRPTSSGTYRHVRSAWDRWNTGRYGGASTLYQGDAFGSGQLTGLATYGDQVTALGALEITSIVVTTPLATGSGSVVLQGAPHASRPSGAPAPTGSTASGTTSVSLPADMREALRTGSAKSLATVGASYRGTRGTSHPSGMALAVTYKRPA